MLRGSKLVFEIGLALAPLASSQAPQDPIRDFWGRYGHQTALVDRRLYIDGGYVSANPVPKFPDAVMNQGLLYQDIDVLTNGMPKLFNNLTKNNTIPDVSGGVLWADEINEILYLYGGEYPDVPQPFSFWGYDTVLDQWNETAPPQSPVPGWVAWGAGTAINARGEGYYYGGYTSNRTTPEWSGPSWAGNSLLKYDMINNFWTNNTGPDPTGRAEGVMVTIPASKQGLLVYFGGVTFPYENETEVPALMSDIHVFEVAESKWYLQIAGGDIPDPRRKFCAGAAWAPDQTSYNIYLYGGAGFGVNATGFDDVYILSMPSFQWIKWWPTALNTGHPHNSLSCNVVGNAQMLIIGGTFPASRDSSLCDAPDVWGTHNLDLRSKWQTFNSNLTGYTVPSELVGIIGGSPSGGATETAPAQGWGANNDLSVYFAQTAAYTIRSPTRTVPMATGITSPKQKQNVATIGAAVGGSLGVLVLALVTLGYWIRSRRGSGRQFEGLTKGNLHAHCPSEMQGQITQPTELPSRNSAMMDSYETATTSTSYKQKIVSPTRPSPPASTDSPVESTANRSPLSLNTNTVPLLLSDTRLGSSVYQHPAHQPLSSQEYYPPPSSKSDILSGSILARPHTSHGRTHELPASRSPGLMLGGCEERSAIIVESASRSTYSLT